MRSFGLPLASFSQTAYASHMMMPEKFPSTLFAASAEREGKIEYATALSVQLAHLPALR